MESNAEIVQGLRQRILQLIRLYENKCEECNRLGSKVEELEGLLRNKNREVDMLKIDYKKLVTASGLKSGSKDAVEAKRNISKMVREIDKCIALLNKQDG